MLGITHRSFLKISLRHLSPNKIKKLCQMPILQTIEMNCQLLDISNLCLIIFQILQALYLF